MIYDNYYSTFYLVQGPVIEARYAKEAAALKRFMSLYLPEDKKSKVLEMGCGVGFFMYLLEKEGYSNILGIDLSEEALTLCRNNATKKCRQGNIMDELHRYRNAGETFDLIVAFDFMEHFSKEEIVDIFVTCRQLLNSGGKFVIKVGNMANITGSHLFHLDFTHKVGFTEESLQHLFTMAGFSRCEFTPVYPATRSSKLKAHVARWLHEFIYWIERVKCPQVTSRKIIAVGYN
jgi:cyclopropane fatty-acyl-phospholipid synthase-like methyltransferase